MDGSSRPGEPLEIFTGTGGRVGAAMRIRLGLESEIGEMNMTGNLVGADGDTLLANVATSALSLNRALGGGWEIRGTNEFVPGATLQRIRGRTDLGDIADNNYDSKKDMLLFPRPNTDAEPSTQPSEK
jgi:hypothetical protein